MFDLGRLIRSLLAPASLAYSYFIRAELNPIWNLRTAFKSRMLWSMLKFPGSLIRSARHSLISFSHWLEWLSSNCLCLVMCQILYCFAYICLSSLQCHLFLHFYPRKFLEPQWYTFELVRNWSNQVAWPQFQSKRYVLYPIHLAWSDCWLRFRFLHWDSFHEHLWWWSCFFAVSRGPFCCHWSQLKPEQEVP